MIALGIFFTIMGAIFILCGLTSIDSFGGTFFLISAAVTALGVFLWCMGRRREADIMEQEQEAIQNGTTPPKRKGPIFATIIFFLLLQLRLCCCLFLIHLLTKHLKFSKINVKLRLQRPLLPLRQLLYRQPQQPQRPKQKPSQKWSMILQQKKVSSSI
ncbi:hypothetical protein SAMN05216469_12815 [Ruminococcus albus]|uniref:Uncharacterized protein n=1 Tax=Ruminococcus albus TaxID=1264 RepID=A0A1H7Q3K1_RUMAL|nr:hypothetical protein SAMN05216469_12815 [Ruminococcus albus]